MPQNQDIGHDRRCASLRLGYVKWVAAQPGVSVPQSQDVEAIQPKMAVQLDQGQSSG